MRAGGSARAERTVGAMSEVLVHKQIPCRKHAMTIAYVPADVKRLSRQYAVFSSTAKSKMHDND
jgi:hypothetical protein